MNEPLLLSGAEQLISRIPKGSTVFAAGYSGQPSELIKALVRNVSTLQPLRIITGVFLRDASALSEWPGREAGRVDLLYASRAFAPGFRRGWADYLPMHLSEVPEAFASGRLHIDVALVQAAPPDSKGRCHLGLSVDVVPDAVQAAKLVLVEFNGLLPRAEGNSWIPADSIDAAIQVDRNPPLYRHSRDSDTTQEIARNVTALIPNGATLQLGVGQVSEAVADALVTAGRTQLGIHTGLFTDGLMRLVLSGAVTNTHKGIDPHTSIATMAIGGRKLHGFLHSNPKISLHPVSYTHNPDVLRRLNRLVSVSGAFQVDLSGAINAEAVEGRAAGGIGGQLDFGRAARASLGGKFIVALPAAGRQGKQSRIVAYLGARSPVTTPRTETEWVVTEYGSANLRGLTLGERAEAMIELTHPIFRDELWRAARRRI